MSTAAGLLLRFSFSVVFATSSMTVALATFSPTGSLLSPRDGGRATRLDDGRVRISGGHDGWAPLLTDEIYDPATKSFALAGGEPAAPLPVLPEIARHGHAVTPLPDGRLLVTGGRAPHGALLMTVEVYTPGDASPQPAGTMAAPREEHGAVMLSDGSVLLIGGRDDAGLLATAELYDPALGSSTIVEGLREPRVRPAVALLGDGQVLAAGGAGADGVPVAHAELYSAAAAAQPTNTVLRASVNPSSYGQAVTYTASVEGLAAGAHGTVEFFDGSIRLGTTDVDAAGTAALTTAVTGAGLRAITARYGGTPGHEPSESAQHRQEVAKTATTSTLTVSPQSRQYSDRITLEITVSGAHGAAPAKEAVFAIAGQQFAEPVPFKKSSEGVWKATLANQPLVDSSYGQLRPTGSTKLVTVSFKEPNDGYHLAVPSTKVVLVHKEDARVAYEGERAVTTASRSSGHATIRLRARVNDISIATDANGDRDRGDIRRAQVAFINRATGATIANVPVAVPDGHDTTSGVASYDWKVDIGTAAAKTFTVGMMVNDYYHRNATADNATITVSRQR